MKKGNQEQVAEPERAKPAEEKAMVADGIPDPLIVLNLNEEVVYANSAYLKKFGYKSFDELKGKSLKEVTDIFVNPEEDFQKIMGLFRGVLEKDYIEQSRELKLRRIDGTKEFIISASGTTIKDAEGNPKSILVTLRDITELKRLQAKEKQAAAVAAEKAKAEELEKAYKDLKDTQNELMIRHQAIETSTGGTAIADMKGNLTDVNWAFLFLWGYREKEEVIGKSIKDFWAEESAGQVKDLVKVVKEEGAWRDELMGVRKDGTSFWVDVNASVLLDRADEPVGMTYFFTDITERKRTEEKMRETSKMAALGQFVAGAAHEINNPLSIITMVTQDLTSRFKEASSKTLSRKDFRNLIRDLETINKQGMRCGDITQGLLAFGRREKDVEKIPISINEVMGEVLRMIGHQLELSKIKVINETKRFPKVLANSSRMNQVFMNIILNARQAMPKGGKLEIKSEPIIVGDKDYVRVEITDTGEGISEKNLARVSEPFFTTRKVGTGAGLGLSIAYSIVKEHGGDIDIESELGKGTKVIVTLPVV